MFALGPLGILCSTIIVTHCLICVKVKNINLTNLVSVRKFPTLEKYTSNDTLDPSQHFCYIRHYRPCIQNGCQRYVDYGYSEKVCSHSDVILRVISCPAPTYITIIQVSVTSYVLYWEGNPLNPEKQDSHRTYLASSPKPHHMYS